MYLLTYLFERQSDGQRSSVFAGSLSKVATLASAALCSAGSLALHPGAPQEVIEASAAPRVPQQEAGLGWAAGLQGRLSGSQLSLLPCDPQRSLLL